jgi:hypothetical protein
MRFLVGLGWKFWVVWKKPKEIPSAFWFGFVSLLPLDLEVVDGEGWCALDYGELAAVA